jgi:tetratricopeptide (TPR) repeat protein
MAGDFFHSRRRRAAGLWHVLLPVLLLSPHIALSATAWQHVSSPFRARFEVISEPNHPQAGLAVFVPVCGLAPAAGTDLFAFDSAGNQLQLLGISATSQNQALALVSPRPVKSEILLYFGSRLPSPQNRHAFQPCLTVNCRTLPSPQLESWRQVETQLRRSQDMGTLMTDTIALTHNPVNSADAFIMDFQGCLKIDAAGDYTYMLVSDDAGYLFVDDKLVIERNGRRGAGDALRGENRVTLKLAAGIHPIRCVVAEGGGSQAAVVARYLDERTKFALRPNDFVQPGKTRLLAVESRDATVACPAFTYVLTTYMSFDDKQYTEVHLKTFGEGDAEWRFSDGGAASGRQVRHIFTGLDERQVQVRLGQFTATGTINFPESPVPPQLQINNPAHYQQYASIIMEEDLRRIELPTLLNYRHFLGFREFNPQLQPVCEAILQSPDLPEQLGIAVLIDLARASGATDQDKAARAYSSAARRLDPRSPEWTLLMSEFADFALLQKGDLPLAEALLKTMAQQEGVAPERILSLRLDQVLTTGRKELAAQILEQLRQTAAGKIDQRLASVRSNARREHFYDLLENGFLLTAQDVLWEWLHLAPGDRCNGSWSLAKARLWRACGWRQGALNILELAMTFDPLLPNLPEVQFEKAVLLAETDKKEQAAELFRYIAEQYPNHPAAAAARQRLP